MPRISFHQLNGKKGVYLCSELIRCQNVAAQPVQQLCQRCNHTLPIWALDHLKSKRNYLPSCLLDRFCKALGTDAAVCEAGRTRVARWLSTSALSACGGEDIFVEVPLLLVSLLDSTCCVISGLAANCKCTPSSWAEAAVLLSELVEAYSLN